MDFINIFITFGGRINRAKYWIAVLIYSAIYIVIGMLAYVGGDSAIIRGLNAALSILVIIWSFGVTIKRLHDRNKTGWFVLLFMVAPMILFAAGLMIGTMSTGSDLVATVLWLIAFVIVIWAFIELGCLRGTIGQNKYGPDPLAPEVLTPPVRTHA